MLTKHMILNIGVYRRGSPLSATAPPQCPVHFVLCTCIGAIAALPIGMSMRLLLYIAFEGSLRKFIAKM